MALALSLATPREAKAFCGFYVGKAEGKLFNDASKVVIVRHEDHTVISMMNDYRGDLKQFALVVPVPAVLQRGQIHIGDRKLFERIDAYSAPRLVEYFDPDPCAMRAFESLRMAPMAAAGAANANRRRQDKALGVTIEAQYTVGEYDIVILSAEQSDGLETWLDQNGYRVPPGASRALSPYIKQNMKFFVARVNLGEQARAGLGYLRPLQFAFDSPKFALPIRLGMVNAQGPQDLLVYVLTKSGRVETTNYRTIKLPSGIDLPEHIAGDFSGFYKAMFEHQSAATGPAIFTEYVWNMGWCDPCAADPLSVEELRALGVFWLDPKPWEMRGYIAGGAMPVMLTRLHVRYTPDTFPEDLVFQETQDSENFQARYVLRHAWQGSRLACPAARTYLDEVERRHREEAETLASLTGWKAVDIFQRAGLPREGGSTRWWSRLWK